MNEIGIEMPIFAFLTLTGVKGYSMYVDPSHYHFMEKHAIDRDILFLPEIVIDNLIGFGIEEHDDVADACANLILGIVKKGGGMLFG